MARPVRGWVLLVGLTGVLLLGLIPAARTHGAMRPSAFTLSQQEGTPAVLGTDPGLAGDGTSLLPPGDGEGLVPIVVGPLMPGEWLPTVMRNTTDQDMELAGGSVAVRDANGSLVAVGERWRSLPFRVQPGGYALVFFRLDLPRVPDGAMFDFSPGWNEVGGSEPQRVDLVVVEVAFRERTLVGMVSNPSDDRLDGGMVAVVCLDDAGEMVNWGFDGLAQDNVMPGSTAGFEVELKADPTTADPCPHLLVASAAAIDE